MVSLIKVDPWIQGNPSIRNVLHCVLYALFNHRVLHLLWKMGHFEQGKVPQAMSTKPSLSTGRKGSFKFTVSIDEHWSSRA